MATTMESPQAGVISGEYQQRQSMRPRSKSAFSITSDKSQGSRRSAGDKEKFRESQDEKRKLAFSNTTKANPNAAMNELQPIAQQLEKATIGSLRASQYFDMHGAPITDPDFSNPTRRRTERPLETIMSFEAAIDREYKRQREAAREAARQSYIDNGGAAQDNNGFESRRSSYWGGGDYAGNGYYNNPQRDQRYVSGPPSRNKFATRMNSDSVVHRHSNSNNGYPYSTPGYGQTRDTVNTGGSNGSASDQWHNSTDPSSDNSSIERTKAEHGETYGYPTPQREPIAEDGHYTYSNGGGYNPAYLGGGAAGGPSGQAGYLGQQLNNGPPAPPSKLMQGGPVQVPPRAPIKLDNSARPDIIPGGTGPPPPEKRKSWLKRTFSKKT